MGDRPLQIVPPHPTDDQLVTPSVQPGPVMYSYQAIAEEQDLAYRALTTIAQSYQLSANAVSNLVCLERYINSLGDISPQLLAQLRDVQMMLARKSIEHIERYVDRDTRSRTKTQTVHQQEQW